MKRCLGCRKRSPMKGSPYCRTCTHMEHPPLCRVCGDSITDGGRWVYCSHACSLVYYAQLRRDNAAAGLCPRCGSESEKGKLHCRKCLDHLRGINRARQENAKRTQCRRCIRDNPDWRKFRTCPACREWQREYRATMKDRTGRSWSDYCTDRKSKRKGKRNG